MPDGTPIGGLASASAPLRRGAPAPAAVTPVTFDGCFGWLHGAVGPRGVVLCGTIGFEGQCLHRPWRVLAEQLAAAGVPALRFDYPGTGDAGEDSAAPDLVPAWLDAVGNAAAFLRRHAGVAEVALVGVRLGGMLAALAARRLDVDRLALLAPIASGRAYVRAQRAMADMSDLMPPGEVGSDWLEAPALRLHGSTARALSGLDLRRLPAAPARRVLLVESASVGAAGHLAASLGALGCAVERREFDGYNALMRDSHLNQVPDRAWALVVDWLRPEGAGRMPAATPAPLPPAVLRGRDWVEEAVRFPSGQGATLCGVRARPAGPGGRAEAVLFCNTGANPHHGYGRAAVNLARGLAGHGVASFRMDFAGLGDSEGTDLGDLPYLYARHRGDEIRAALDMLERAGHDRFTLVGICSGAFQAMQATLADRRVGGVVLVNQLLYDWPDRARRAWLPARLRRRDAGAPDLGEIAEAEEEMLRTVVRYRRTLLGELRHRARRAAGRLDAVAAALGARTALGYPRRAFRALSARGVRCLVMAGEDDAALRRLEVAFGRDARGLLRLPGVRLELVRGVDHSFGSSRAQDLLLRALLAHLGAAPPAA